ncbi:MAG: type II toxin-antitoxin system HicB family antitoxin [Candidatus Wallbacteria bacterium]|nr:type II toxin-antitoxin system HicB family antitoxin [Candidatus Wallbacteria bacterium]
MIDLQYSLVIEAMEDPEFFGFYSTDLEGFTGIGHSVEDCIYKAKWGMPEHIALLKEQNLPVPQANPNPQIIIRNEKKAA